MKWFASAAGVLLLASLLTACSHAPANPGKSIEAAAAAREKSLQQARAAATARDEDRQEIGNIPLPSKNIYMAIHTRQSWMNPFLVVSKSTLNLSIMYPDQGLGGAPDNSPGSDLLRPAAARRRVLDLRLSDLSEALAALPANTWPYGRVIAVEEDPLAPRSDRAQVRANVEATIQMLGDLGVVVYEWPAGGPR